MKVFKIAKKNLKKVLRIFEYRWTASIVCLGSFSFVMGLVLLYPELETVGIVPADEKSQAIYESYTREIEVGFGNKEDTDSPYVSFRAVPGIEGNMPREIEALEVEEKLGDRSTWEKAGEGVRRLLKREEKVGIEMVLIATGTRDEKGESLPAFPPEADCPLARGGVELQIKDMLGTGEEVRSETELTKEEKEGEEREVVINREIAEEIDARYEMIAGKGVKEEIVIRKAEGYGGGCLKRISNDEFLISNQTSNSRNQAPNEQDLEIGSCSLPKNTYTFELKLDEGVQIHQSFTGTGDKRVWYFTDRYGRYLGHFLPPFAVDGKDQRTNDVAIDIAPIPNDKFTPPAPDQREGGQVISNQNPNTNDQNFTNLDLDIDNSKIGNSLGQLEIRSIRNYQLTVTVDLQWLLSPDRVYPITIDPSIVHDTEAEFLTGTENRVEVTSDPKVQLTYHELPADEHTVGLWHINNDWTDSSGNGNNGTATGATFTTSSKLGSHAGSFDGNDYVNLGSSSHFDFGTDSFSAEIWFKTSGGDNDHFFVYTDTSYNNPRWYFRVNSNTINITATDGTTTGGYSSGTELTDNAWHHAVMVVDRDANEFRVYIDGLLKETDDISGIGSMTQTDANVVLGSASVSASYAFIGSLDEAVIHNRALTPEEIKAHAKHRPYGIYTSDVLDLTADVQSIDSLGWTEHFGGSESPVTEEGLVGWWHMNNDWTDSSNEGNDGTATGAIFTTSSKLGSHAGSLDGAGDYVTAELGTLDAPFTVSSWAYFNQLNQGSGDYDYVINIGQASSNAMMSVSRFQGDGADANRFYCWTGAVLSYGPVLQGQEWLHIVVVANSSMPYLQLYINGEEQTIDQPSGAINTNGHLEMGKYLGASTHYLDGLIDETRIYSRALSAPEILSNYQSGNIEFQTRSGADDSPDDGSWENWKPVTSESQIDSMDVISGEYNPANAMKFPDWATVKFVEKANQNINLTTLKSQLSANGISYTENAQTYIPYYNGTTVSLKEFSSSVSFTKDTTCGAKHMTIVAGDTIVVGFQPQSDINTPYNLAIYNSYRHNYMGVSTTRVGTYNMGTGDNCGATYLLDETLDYIHTYGGTSRTHSTFSSTLINSNGYLLVAIQNEYGVISDGNTHFNLNSQQEDTKFAWLRGTAAGETSLECLEGTWYTAYVSSSYTSVVKNDATPRLRARDQSHSGTAGGGTLVIIGEYATLPTETHTFTNLHLDWIDENLIAPVKVEPVLSDIFNEIDNNFKIEGAGSLKTTIGTSQVDFNTVALWHLDETNGDLAGVDVFDETANNNDGELNGSGIATGVVDGIYGKARSFNGSDDYIRTTRAVQDDFTVELWFNTTDTGSGGGTYYWYNGDGLVDSEVSGVVDDFGISHHSNGYVVAGVGNPDTHVVSSAGYNDGNWHNVAFTRVKSSGVIKLYIDGIFVDSDTGGTQSLTSATYTDIGRIQHGNNYFHGTIDEVRISDTARTQEEIAEAYRMGRDHRLSRTITSTDLSSKTKLPFWIAGDRPGTYLEATIGESAYANYLPDANTVGLWHFDEKSGSGAYFRDSSDNNKNATPQSGVTSIQGKIGGGTNTNAISEYLTIPAITPAASYTISAWSYFPLNNTGSWRTLIQKTGGGYHHIIVDVNGLLGVYNSGFYSSGFDIDNLSTGWHYIAAIASGSITDFYIDSQKVGTANTKVLQGISTFGNHTGGGQHWGSFDEVRISNIARSAEEIRQAYEIGRRTHPITIDFSASLDSSNLITNSSDLSFTVDATAYGFEDKGDNLYKGDKMIVKENYGGTEYIAQGDVTAITVSTGAVTIDAWDASSSFPASGYTANAIVFKWQREWFDITAPLSSHINATTNITLRVTDGSEGRTFWLDDFKSGGAYDTLSPIDLTARYPSPERYFQYRAIFSTTDTVETPWLSDVTVNYTSGPALNQLMRHGKYFSGGVKQPFWWAK